MSSKIPTTDEFFQQYSNLLQFEEGDPEYLIDKEDFKTSMIKFATLHVKEAIKSVLTEGLDETDLNSAIAQHTENIK
jgi:hypothetical protein